LLKLRTRIRRLSTNEVVPYRMHLLVRVWDRNPDVCASKLSAIKNSILKLGGAQAYEPTLPTSVRNYWQLCMPGWSWGNYNDFKLYVEDVNLADLLPISSTPTGDLDEAEAIYDGPRGALVGCTTFVGKEGAMRPEHGIMFGASGAGKSVFTIDLLTQTAPYYDFTAIVEEGLSCGRTGTSPSTTSTRGACRSVLTNWVVPQPSRISWPDRRRTSTRTESARHCSPSRLSVFMWTSSRLGPPVMLT
jgi:hypothetical protein